VETARRRTGRTVVPQAPDDAIPLTRAVGDVPAARLEAAGRPQRGGERQQWRQRRWGRRLTVRRDTAVGDHVVGHALLALLDSHGEIGDSAVRTRVVAVELVRPLQIPMAVEDRYEAGWMVGGSSGVAAADLAGRKLDIVGLAADGHSHVVVVIGR